MTVANGYVNLYDPIPRGGGINNAGTLLVDNSTFSGNYTLYGAGIYSSGGSVTVRNSNFVGNYTYSTLDSHGGGSGIYIASGTLDVINSTFSNNRNDGVGGGAYNGTGTVTVSNSTFSGNSATEGGALYCLGGTITVSNSTFSGNGAYQGGGVSIGNAYLTVINSTFSGNTAYLSGASFSSGGTAILRNTIAANGSGGKECRGLLTDGGGNLSYPADSTCPGIHLNPLLGPLQDNGGPTQTMALGAGSPAIDAGNSTGCQNTQINNRDQRGYARFVDGNGDKVASCDIGAFEYGASGPPTATLDRDPPVTTIELNPAEPDGPNGWYRSPVTVTPQASDASPVIDLRCALDPASPPAAFDDLPEEVCPFLGGAEVTADGVHIFWAAAMDIWGNKSAPVSAGFQIDTTPSALTSLEVTVNREEAYAGAILEYRLVVQNLTRVAQEFVVTDPIPDNTEIVRSINYDPAANAVEWEGVVEPWGFKTFQVYVRIKGSTPGGTAIVNTATLKDEVGGGSASATTTVKMLPPYRGHREDVDVKEMVIRGD